MIYLIGGSSHTGKTCLAQRLLEKYHYPYLSIDHLKMGLIRSGQTSLTPEDDEELTGYLWPIVREMVKTAVENSQNLIVEGAYIPFDYKKDFSEEYLKHIQYLCLIFSEDYIKNRFDSILSHANDIEQRLEEDPSLREMLLEESRLNLEQCRKYGCPYFLIDKEYPQGTFGL